jgi:hypothetical protein
MTWQHYPNSPFGNIDICKHGCTRDHGDTNPNCLYCDYPPNTISTFDKCPKCKATTHHIAGFCLKCGYKPNMQRSDYMTSKDIVNGKCLNCNEPISNDIFCWGCGNGYPATYVRTKRENCHAEACLHEHVPKIRCLTCPQNKVCNTGELPK